MPQELVAPSLATKEWWAVAANAAATFTLVEVELRPKGDGLTTLIEVNRDGNTSIGTTKEVFAKNNPNRSAFTFINHSANPVACLPDSDVTTTNGIVVQGNGGSLVVEGNVVKVFGPASALPPYYDRNPSITHLTFNTNPGAAAEADGTRATYTVPAGRSAFVESIYVNTFNDSAVAVNGRGAAYVNVNIAGGGANPIIEAFHVTGEASFARPIVVTGFGLLEAGDVLTLNSNTNNTAAGTNVFNKGSAKLVEFGT